MEELFYGPWIWDDVEPAEPHWRGPAGTCGLFDVRSLPQCGTAGGMPGVGLFVVAVGTKLPSEYELLGGADWREVKTSQKLRDMIPCRKGFSPTGDTLPELIRSSICEGADPTGQEFAKPLLPERGYVARLILGDLNLRWLVKRDSVHWSHCLDVLRADLAEVFDDAKAGRLNTRHAVGDGEHHRRLLDGLCIKFQTEDWKQFVPRTLVPEIPGRLPRETVLADDFNRADSTGLGAGWLATINTSPDVVSNEARGANENQGCRCRYESDLSSVDHSGEITVVRFHPTRLAGPCTRYSSSADTCYRWGLQNAPTRALVKTVAGVTNTLSTDSTALPGVPAALKLAVVGPSLTPYINSVAVSSLAVSDSSLTTGIRCGMLIGGDTTAGNRALHDNFQAWDVGSIARRRLGGCQHANMNPIGVQGVRVY